MRAVVTVLRASTGAAAAAAAATADYVAGSRQGSLPASRSGDAVDYYADQTPEGPGRWLGHGAERFGLDGPVDRSDLEALLRGDDPRSGVVLLDTRGSTRRANPGHAASHPTTWDQATYTFAEASTLLGVSDRYLRRIAGRTRTLLVRTGGDATTLAAVNGRRAFLIADQHDDGRWRVNRDELVRFAAQRRVASVLIGFDVTFSVPKSVSVLWAAADATTRAAITNAFAEAVQTGVAYLERHCAVTGRGADRVHGRGLTAATFTHATSRRLDPQLHAHVIIANVVERTDHSHRALDGSGLFAHAKTAGYLAGAQLRHELTTRLGVAWRTVRSGIIEVDGIPQSALDAMSTRRAEIDAVADELGVTSTTGRRRIALHGRTAKQATSLARLRTEWAARLTEVGFDGPACDACLHATTTASPTRLEIHEEFGRLLRHDGLTAHTSTFTRHDVVQALADWSVDRLDATNIERVADKLFTDPRVLALHPPPPSSSSPRPPPRDGVDEARFTTKPLVYAEARVLDSFRAGVRARVGRVEPDVIAAALDASTELGVDQRDAINHLCRSGHRIQCLVGPAGSGKTHTLRSAATAWRNAGYRVVGTAVQGTAAENLEAATTIPTRTLAAFLNAAERATPDAVLDARSVVVLDEASTVGTFDLARLLRIVEDADASLILVGDPAQHGAVSAGGGFAALTRRYPHLAVKLAGPRRQVSDDMAGVRRAVDELRTRQTDIALHRLVVDGRLHDAPTRDDAYHEMITDWANDRTAPTRGHQPRRVCMITEDHTTRRALITHARAHLQATGELTGPALTIAGQAFQAGDEIIARAPDRTLHPPGTPERHVRNGTTGRVLAVHQPEDAHPGLWVDFHQRGPIFVPREALDRELRAGTTGILTHSYALTSHAAQGATYDTARAFATDTTSPTALYVAASRGRDDLHFYTAPRHDSHDEHDTPGVLHRDRETGLQALARTARTRRDDCLALERDPTLVDRVERVDGTPHGPTPPETATPDAAPIVEVSEAVLTL